MAFANLSSHGAIFCSPVQYAGPVDQYNHSASMISSVWEGVCVMVEPKWTPQLLPHHTESEPALYSESAHTHYKCVLVHYTACWVATDALEGSAPLLLTRFSLADKDSCWHVRRAHSRAGTHTRREIQYEFLSLSSLMEGVAMGCIYARLQ